MRIELHGGTKAIGSIWFSLRRVRRHPYRRWGGWPVQRAWANETEAPFRSGRGAAIRVTPWHLFSIGHWSPTDPERLWYREGETPMLHDVYEDDSDPALRAITKTRTVPWTYEKAGSNA